MAPNRKKKRCDNNNNNNSSTTVRERDVGSWAKQVKAERNSVKFRNKNKTGAIVPRHVDDMSTALVHLLLIFVFGAAHALPVDQWTSESALVEVTTKVEGTSSSASSLLLADQLLADDASSLMGSQSRQKPADDGGIEFPNTAFIPGDLTEQLSVDGFFSLWFVFLDDDVFTSGQFESHFFFFFFFL